MSGAFEVVPGFLVPREELLAKQTEFRARIVSVARKWIGVRYFPREASRAAGCDCGSLLLGIYMDAGILERDFQFSNYQAMAPFQCRGADADYLGALSLFMKEIREPSPADVVLYHMGRGWSHAALIVRWPGMVVNAGPRTGVVAVPGVTGRLAGREMKFWSVFA